MGAALCCSKWGRAAGGARAAACAAAAAALRAGGATPRVRKPPPGTVWAFAQGGSAAAGPSALPGAASQTASGGASSPGRSSSHVASLGLPSKRRSTSAARLLPGAIAVHRAPSSILALLLWHCCACCGRTLVCHQRVQRVAAQRSAASLARGRRRCTLYGWTRIIKPPAMLYAVRFQLGGSHRNAGAAPPGRVTRGLLFARGTDTPFIADKSAVGGMWRLLTGPWLHARLIQVPPLRCCSPPRPLLAASAGATCFPYPRHPGALAVLQQDVRDTQRSRPRVKCSLVKQGWHARSGGSTRRRASSVNPARKPRAGQECGRQPHTATSPKWSCSSSTPRGRGMRPSAAPRPGLISRAAATGSGACLGPRRAAPRSGCAGGARRRAGCPRRMGSGCCSCKGARAGGSGPRGRVPEPPLNPPHSARSRAARTQPWRLPARRVQRHACVPCAPLLCCAHSPGAAAPALVRAALGPLLLKVPAQRRGGGVGAAGVRGCVGVVGVGRHPAPGCTRPRTCSAFQHFQPPWALPASAAVAAART